MRETGKFQKLDDNLKEIAILRLENPDMSLVDLGKLLKEPVGKSGDSRNVPTGSGIKWGK